ncbi:aldo/keto reductase [Sphingobacterium lumbrici]|uniref:aldo/keto reductase n=1 Tax=Sphingobacterium lumbrici TaxID=2559600 RepID=UPI00112B23F3|nr:aldo/keto reductase [Sphingobacterium lumbrici]
MYNPGIDKIILGTAGLGGLWGEVNADESIATIWNALSHGIVALDTAPAYGDAEEFVGRALAQWDGARPAISTKVGRLKSYRADEGHYDYTNDGMQRSLDNSLKTLDTSVIDVLFLHDPSAIAPDTIEGVVRQMQYFKAQGLTRKIGIGGNMPEWFAPYLEGDVFDVVMEYNKLNACCIEALSTTVVSCCRANKEYYAASPLNMGMLGRNFQSFSSSPPSWLDLKTIEQAQKVNAIAEQHRMPLDVLALRFLCTVPAPFRMVLGAADNEQLASSLHAIEAGALSPDIYNEILHTLN